MRQSTHACKQPWKQASVLLSRSKMLMDCKANYERQHEVLHAMHLCRVVISPRHKQISEVVAKGCWLGENAV